MPLPTSVSGRSEAFENALNSARMNNVVTEESLVWESDPTYGSSSGLIAPAPAAALAIETSRPVGFPVADDGPLAGAIPSSSDMAAADAESPILIASAPAAALAIETSRPLGFREAGDGPLARLLDGPPQFPPGASEETSPLSRLDTIGDSLGAGAIPSSSEMAAAESSTPVQRRPFGRPRKKMSKGSSVSVARADDPGPLRLAADGESDEVKGRTRKEHMVVFLKAMEIAKQSVPEISEKVKQGLRSRMETGKENPMLRAVLVAYLTQEQLAANKQLGLTVDIVRDALEKVRFSDPIEKQRFLADEEAAILEEQDSYSFAVSEEIYKITEFITALDALTDLTPDAFEEALASVSGTPVVNMTRPTRRGASVLDEHDAKFYKMMRDSFNAEPQITDPFNVVANGIAGAPQRIKPEESHWG